MTHKTFQIKFHDSGIHPYSIRASDLAMILRSLDEGLCAIVASDNPSLSDNGFSNIALVGIKEGCAALEFDYGNYTVNFPAFQRLVSAIRESTVDSLPAKAKGIVTQISTFNAKYECKTELWSSKDNKLPDAVIPIPVITVRQDYEEIRGFTSVYGEVIRVGGQRGARVDIKMNTGVVLEIKTTKEMVIEAGNRMYQTIGVYGEATWDMVSGAITSFTAEKLLDYVDTPLDKAFAALKEEFGSHFDGIADVDGFVSRLRGE